MIVHPLVYTCRNNQDRKSRNTSPELENEEKGAFPVSREQNMAFSTLCDGQSCQCWDTAVGPEEERELLLESQATSSGLQVCSVTGLVGLPAYNSGDMPAFQPLGRVMMRNMWSVQPV